MQAQDKFGEFIRMFYLPTYQLPASSCETGQNQFIAYCFLKWY